MAKSLDNNKIIHGFLSGATFSVIFGASVGFISSVVFSDSNNDRNFEADNKYSYENGCKQNAEYQQRLDNILAEFNESLPPDVSFDIKATMKVKDSSSNSNGFTTCPAPVAKP